MCVLSSVGGHLMKLRWLMMIHPNFNIDSDLSNNAMSGYLPEELGQLQNLDSL
jgi:hypothetical protein